MSNYRWYKMELGNKEESEKIIIEMTTLAVLALYDKNKLKDLIDSIIDFIGDSEESNNLRSYILLLICKQRIISAKKENVFSE